MIERDPRNNPQPGDVVAKGILTREVTARGNNQISYINQSSRRNQCWITTWQQWCRQAVVTSVGSEEQVGEST